MTCDRRAPECYPKKLREADTVIQPAKDCDGIHAERELCIGALDGSVAATNMDSGGPGLVRDGGHCVPERPLPGQTLRDVAIEVPVLRDGVTVVGVHSTGNDNGEQCTANNPCEVAADGTVTVRQGARYGQRVTHLVERGGMA